MPEIRSLCELNRVLLAIIHLSTETDRCSVRSVIELCSSINFGGQPANHKETLRMCRYIGLIEINEQLVHLTEMGRTYILLNQPSTYELSPQQVPFIVHNFLLNGPWRPQVRDFVLSFSPNHPALTFELDTTIHSIPLRNRPMAHLLKALGVIQGDYLLTVAPEYVAPVMQIRADHKGFTDDALSEILDAQRRLGAKAEEAVLNFERNRLLALGDEASSKLVPDHSDK